MLVEAKPLVRVLWLWAPTTKAQADTDPMDLPPQLFAGCISNLQLIWAEPRLSCFCELSLQAQFYSCNSPFKNLPRAVFLSRSSAPTWISFILSGVLLSSFLSPSSFLPLYLFSLPAWLAWKRFTKALLCDLVFLSQPCGPENSSVIWILTPSDHAGVLSCQFLHFFCTLSAELLLHVLSCAQLSSSQGQVPISHTLLC